MSEHEPTILIACVEGGPPGVAKTGERLSRLVAAGKLRRSTEQILEGFGEWQGDGLTNCNHIAPALLLDLTEAGWSGWRLMRGYFNGGSDHSWIERGDVAVDGSRVEDGAPTILVMGSRAYRELTGSRPVRVYGVNDVLSGKFLRPLPPPTGTAAVSIPLVHIEPKTSGQDSSNVDSRTSQDPHRD